MKICIDDTKSSTSFGELLPGECFSCPAWSEHSLLIRTWKYHDYVNAVDLKTGELCYFTSGDTVFKENDYIITRECNHGNRK